MPLYSDHPKKHSYMDDTIHQWGWNPTTHLRVNVVSAGSFSVDCPRCDLGEAWGSYHPVPFLSDLRAQGLLIPSLSAGGDFDDWLYRSFSRFVTQFPPEMSLANSLYELKNGVKEFLPEVSDIRAGIDANFLKYKFGIAPVLQDLKDLCGVWGKFKNRLEFLRDTRGKTYRERKRLLKEGSGTEIYLESRQFAYQSYPEPPPPPGQIGFLGYIDELDFHRTGYQPLEFQSQWILHGVISNMIGEMDSLVRQADAFGSVLGLRNLPKIAWNATKWTWLVDWFVDTDKILDKFDNTGPFEGKLALNGCYLSGTHRLSGKLLAKCQHMESMNTIFPDEYLLRLYTRSGNIEQEDLDSSLVQPSLNGDQQAILLALLSQRGRKIPNWKKHLRTIKRLMAKGVKFIKRLDEGIVDYYTE